MSNAAQLNTGGLPQGELLGRYRTYDDAQRVVDHLAAAEGFDIKTLTIVGNDLRSVERIRSRLSYPRVAGAGAAQGAMFGFFIGLLIWLFAPEAPVLNLLLSVVLGMCIWTLIGVVSYAVRRGRREFSSSSQLAATTYDVVCDFAVAGKARQLVSGSGVISLNAWNDPTGRSGSLGGVPAGGPSAPSQPATGEPAAPPPPAQSSATADLPDGRPRYGVRLEEKREKPDDDAGFDSAAHPVKPQVPRAPQGPQGPQGTEAPLTDPSLGHDPQGPRDSTGQEPQGGNEQEAQGGVEQEPRDGAQQ